MNILGEKKYTRQLMFIIFICLIVLGIGLYKNYYSTDETNRNVAKVGIFKYEPCYYMDEEYIKGYYPEVLKIIEKYDKNKYKYKYTYYNYSYEEAIEKLKDGEIDLIMGVNDVNNSSGEFIYSKKSVGFEKYGLYANDNIYKDNDLKSLNGCKLGIVTGRSESEDIKKYLKNNRVKVEIEEYKGQEELLHAFKNKEIDLSVQVINKKNYGQLVYDYSISALYIIGNKNSKEIIDNIDNVIEKNMNKFIKEAETIHRKYYNYKEINLIEYIHYTHYIQTGLLSFIFLVLILLLYNRKEIKSSIIKKRIKERIINEQYLSNYQPIYNPISNEIVGFEALIRQRDKKGNILSPYQFIEEIEKNDMLSEISLMMLKRSILDYERLHEKYNLSGKKYISINISSDEIMNPQFVEECCEIIKNCNLPKHTICLEFIERVKSENIKLLNTSIDKMKEAGFLIAIDDFGMEYSNLDLLDKIDFDIIKLDRYFIYTISKDYVKEEILKFLSSICKKSNSSLVVEGVETQEQINLIKKIGNSKIYVQGYYYSKPVPI